MHKRNLLLKVCRSRTGRETVVSMCDLDVRRREASLSWSKVICPACLERAPKEDGVADR